MGTDGQMSDAATSLGVSLTTSEIMTLIPHRYPMLLVDRIENLIKNESAIGIKNVSANEEYFVGHFPAFPVMPGVLIVESMAQTAAVLVMKSLGDAVAGKPVFFMSIEKARFRKPVTPGDQLRMNVSIVQARRNIYKFAGRAEVNGTLVSDASFAATIAAE